MKDIGDKQGLTNQPCKSIEDIGIKEKGLTNQPLNSIEDIGIKPDESANSRLIAKEKEFTCNSLMVEAEIGKAKTSKRRTPSVLILKNR